MATHRAAQSSAWINTLTDPDRLMAFPLRGHNEVGTNWLVHDRVPPYQLMYMVVGSIDAQIEGKPIRLSTNSHLPIQPSARHTFARGPDRETLTLNFVRLRIGRSAQEVRIERERGAVEHRDIEGQDVALNVRRHPFGDKTPLLSRAPSQAGADPPGPQPTAGLERRVLRRPTIAISWRLILNSSTTRTTRRSSDGGRSPRGEWP